MHKHTQKFAIAAIFCAFFFFAARRPSTKD
jgi:hypothetical protein